jgi:hypothetical protein
VDETVPEEAMQLAIELREQHEAALAATRDRLNGLTEQLRQLTQRQHDINAACPRCARRAPTGCSSIRKRGWRWSALPKN